MKRTQEQSVAEADFRIKMTARDSELTSLKKELEGVSTTNSAMISDSNQMSAHIEAQNSHIQVLTN